MELLIYARHLLANELDDLDRLRPNKSIVKSNRPRQIENI